MIPFHRHYFLHGSESLQGAAGFGADLDKQHSQYGEITTPVQ